MFTGIIEEIGTVYSVKKGIKSMEISIEAEKILKDTNLGSSIAVNGICLTVTYFNQSYFTVDVMPETLRRSSLRNIQTGSKVNLERAMSVNGRFGGHIVTGHIDSAGIISNIKKEGNAVLIDIKTNQKTLLYIVEKGSIAIDGISLTVTNVFNDSFRVSVIPHTFQHTTFLQKNTGDTVNLENDIIAKYLEKLMTPMPNDRDKRNTISLKFLAENGF